jgi:hypothetical protein
MHKFHSKHLDWSVRFADDQQLKKPLMSVESKSDTDPHDSSSVRVSLHQIHRHEEVKLPISQMPDRHPILSDDHEPASCSCLPPFLFSRVSIGGSTLSDKDGLQQPLLGKREADTANTDSPTTRISSDVSDETTTSVTMTTYESVIEVHGIDAPSTLKAVTAAAEDSGMMSPTSTVSKVQEYLKSVVYGGLDVSLISLGIVASAAGGDAKTRTVLAMGLANLIFGSISFFHKIIELHKESPMRFKETVGQSFLLNGCLAFLSFLVFGSLPTLTFGFSFRQSNNHDYKMLATVVVSVISVVLLGCAKVFAKVTQQSYFATLSALIMTGVVAAVAGFYTGEYFSKLLAQFGFDT